MSGVAWATVQTIGTRLISVSVFLVLARLLAPDAFGLVSLAAVFVTLLQVFVEGGFGQAIIQRDDLLSGHLDSAFWSCAAMGLVMTLVAFFGAGPLSELLGEPKLTPILQGLSPCLLLAGLASTAESILRRQLAFKKLALRTMFGAAAGGTVGVAAAIAGLGAWSLVLQVLVQSVVEVIVLWVAVSWRPGLEVSWLHFRQLFGFSVNVVGIELLNFLNRQSDNLLIAAVLGIRALGYYSVAYRILLMLTEVMTQTINAVTLPTFSRVQKDIPRLRSAYLMATRISTTVAMPVFLAMAALAPEIVHVVFGAKWDPSVPVMRILAFIGILHASIYFSGNVLLAIGRGRQALFISVVNAISNVVAFAIAVHWGIAAVAAAYVIRGYLLSPLPVYLVKRVLHFRWRDYLRLVLVPCGCAAAMVVAVLALGVVLEPFLDDLGRLLVLGLVSPLVYWVAMRVFAGHYVSQAANYVAPASPRLSRLIMWKPSLGHSQA
jgi:O-antigen/teichoic acid export membrane protein